MEGGRDGILLGKQACSSYTFGRGLEVAGVAFEGRIRDSKSARPFSITLASQAKDASHPGWIEILSHTPDTSGWIVERTVWRQFREVSRLLKFGSVKMIVQILEPARLQAACYPTRNPTSKV